jgi:hypothetical protein
MKRTTIASTFALAVGISVALGTAPVALADGCSKATLQGTYAYTNTGVLTAPPALAGPFAGVGVQIFDGDGTTTGAAWVSQNGNILQVTLKGTYTVNADCTGTLSLQIAPVGITTQSFLVIDQSGREFRAINTDPPGQAVTTVATKQ